MITGKDQLLHIVSGMNEREAESLLDVIGVDTEDTAKMQTAAELLKVAARLLYLLGSPESVQFGERADAILAELIPIISAK